MKRLIFICLIMLSVWEINAQNKDTVKVRLLVNAESIQIKLNGKNIGNNTNLSLSPGKNRISVYKPFVGVFDTILDVNAATKPSLMVRYNIVGKELRDEFRRQHVMFFVKTGYLVGGTALLTTSVISHISFRKKYMEDYNGLQESLKLYDDARSPNEAANAKERITEYKRRFKESKRTYTSACILDGAFAAVAIGLIYAGFKTHIPIVEDKALLQFNAITINQTVTPSINLLVKL